jgi:hypothetical protein
MTTEILDPLGKLTGQSHFALPDLAKCCSLLAEYLFVVS